MPAGSDGLLVLPYFMGERMPIWDSEARGVMFGLSLHHTRGHVIRALMEGVAFSVYHNIKLAQDHGLAIRRADGDGGGRGDQPAVAPDRSATCATSRRSFMQGAQGAPFGDA